MNRSARFFVSWCLCGLIFSSQRLHAENWPQWRGPWQNGVSRETGLPITWSEKTGVAWKCPLKPWGTSTPAIWGDAIFVTTHVGDQRLVLAKIDKKTGRIYFLNMKGLTTVVAAAPRFEKLAESQLDDATIASPVVSDGRLLIRGHKTLYCLGK